MAQAGDVLRSLVSDAGNVVVKHKQLRGVRGSGILRRNFAHINHGTIGNAADSGNALATLALALLRTLAAPAHHKKPEQRCSSSAADQKRIKTKRTHS